MNISGVSSSPYSGMTGSSKNTESSSTQFKDVFEASKKMAVSESEKANAASASNESKEIREKQWSVTAPDGPVWTVTDIGASLTDSDKAFFEWPSQDEAIMAIAGYVAMDRNDGTLEGQLTQDHLFGNSQKGIFGLIDRFPVGELAQNSITSLLHRFA